MPRTPIELERRARRLEDRYGAYIVYLLQEKECDTFESLFAHFENSNESPRRIGDLLRRILTDLIRCEFVEVRNQGNVLGKRAAYEVVDREATQMVLAKAGGHTTHIEEANEPSHVYQATQPLRNAEEALGIKLIDLGRWVPSMSEVAYPFFGKPPRKRASEACEVFVLMPFAPEMKPIYENHIEPAVRGLGRTCKRADEIYENDAVMRKVWGNIAHADCIVADCTGGNPNVFYEIGIAHTLGVPVILLAQNDQGRVPFDIGHVERIEYDATDAGLRNLEDALKDAIRKVLGV